MFWRLIYVLAIIQLANAQNAPAERTISNESAIKADEKLPTPPTTAAPMVQLPMAHYRRIQHYPAYRIITANKHKTNHTQQTSTTQHSTTSQPKVRGVLTRTRTLFTPEDFPRALLEIAKGKLGLKSLDEVPTVYELADILGTSSPDETINYLRELTSTEHGIALIKSYLESADFTNRTEEERRRQEIEEADTKPQPNFLERMSVFFHIFNLWPHVEAVKGNKNMAHVSQILRHLPGSTKPHVQPSAAVRQPLPQQFPVPLRPMAAERQLPLNAAHLNTPKMVVPPHVQLAKVINIPPQQLQHLLQSKPKLAELAAKVSHFPVTKETAGVMDAQLLAAVQRAVEQDEDLKKLLQAKATLK